MLGPLDFKGLEILGAQLLLSEHSLIEPFSNYTAFFVSGKL